MSIFDHVIEYRMRALPWVDRFDSRESIENSWWWDDLSNTEELWRAAVDNEDYSRQYRSARDSYLEGDEPLAFARFTQIASHLEGIPIFYSKYHFVNHAINWLGVLCEERGDLHAAQMWFELGAKRSSQVLDWSSLNLTRLLIANKDFERARTEINSIKKMLRQSSWDIIDHDRYSTYLVHFLSAQIYEALGQRKRFEKTLLKAISYEIFSNIQDNLWELRNIPIDSRKYEFVQIATLTSKILPGNPEQICVELCQAMIDYRFSHEDHGKTAIERALDLVPDILESIKNLAWPVGICESTVSIVLLTEDNNEPIELYP